MKILIKCDEYELKLSNDNLDNSNYVNLSVWKDDNIQGEVLDVCIDDLMPALIAFDSQRSRERENENE